MILIHLFYRLCLANGSPLCKKVVTVIPEIFLTVRLKILVTSKSKILLTVSLKKLVTVQLKKLLPPYLNSILPLAVQLNNSIERNLKLAKLKGSNAQIENLKTGNGRLYQDSTIKQLSSLDFISDRKNIAIFGESDAGKTYASKAFGVEACKNGYRTLFTDFTDLIDFLFMLRNSDMNKYKKKLVFYSRIQVLILDDFLISQLGDERSLILFSLIKSRDELGTSTIITSQYDPRTWITFLEGDGNFAMGDSIRRRILNNGYTILIEKAV